MTDIDEIIAQRIAAHQSAKDAEQDEQLSRLIATQKETEGSIEAMVGQVVDDRLVPVLARLAALENGQPAPVPAPTPVPAPAPTPVPAPNDLTRGKFEVIAATIYTKDGGKAAKPPGLRYAPMMYQGHFPSLKWGGQTPATDADVKAAVAIYRKDYRGGYWSADWPGVLVDVEHWPLPLQAKPDQAELRKYLEMYADLAKRIKDELQEPLGFYGVGPLGGIVWMAMLANDTTPKGREYQKAIDDANDAWREIFYQHIDFLCPSMYTYYPGEAQADIWDKWAVIMKAQADRIAPDKPCTPFLWPRFHAGGSIKDESFIPLWQWRRELETLKRVGFPGCIWWGGYKTEFSEVQEQYEIALEANNSGA